MKFKRLLTLFLFFLTVNLLLRFLVIAGHKVVTGLNPYVGPIILLLVSLAITPFAVKGYKWLKKNWFTDTDNEVAILFGFAVFSSFILWIITGNSTLDIHFHDTYYIVSNFGILLFFSLLFGMLSAFYYLFPKIFKRELNISFSRIHFWVSYCGLYLLTWMSYHVYEAGEPRRYLDTGGWRSFELFQMLNRQLSAIAILLFTAQILFLFNIIYTLFKKNPGQAIETK